jgi:hypothetical protein
MRANIQGSLHLHRASRRTKSVRAPSASRSMASHTRTHSSTPVPLPCCDRPIRSASPTRRCVNTTSTCVFWCDTSTRRLHSSRTALAQLSHSSRTALRSRATLGKQLHRTFTAASMIVTAV